MAPVQFQFPQGRLSPTKLHSPLAEWGKVWAGKIYHTVADTNSFKDVYYSK